MRDVQRLGASWGRLGCALAAGLCLFGCDDHDALPKRNGVASGELVAIPAGELRTGFAIGVLRGDRQVSAFKISKFPVTWAEYKVCVAAGKCQPAADVSACKPASSAYVGYSAAAPSNEPTSAPAHLPSPLDERNDLSPALCVGESEAEAFCKSMGGRLPTLDEWQLAARGSAPRRFAWGDAPTSCDQHPFASQLLARLTTVDTKDMSGCVQPGNAINKDQFEVGKHPSGAAPSGIQDVLLAPGELLASSKGAQVRACDGPPGSHCVAFGSVPGAIDAVEPFFTMPTEPGRKAVSTVGHPYGFRCVIAGSEGSK